MSNDAHKHHFRVPKALRRALIALGVLLGLAALLLAALPLLLSSEFTRVRVEQAVAKATGKPASLRLLSFGWNDGLRVEGLLIGQGGLDDPAFLCSLERLHARAEILASIFGAPSAELTLSGLRLRQSIGPAGPEPPKPPARPLPELLRESFAALRSALAPGPLRRDARLHAELADIALRLELTEQNATLDLRDAALSLDAPGLRKGPLRLSASCTAQAAGAPPLPFRLEAGLDGLMQPSGQADPSRAAVRLRAEAPGLSLDTDGTLASGLKTKLRLDLRQALAPLKPLLRSAPELDGRLALDLAAARPGPDALDLAVALSGEGLRASGGPLGAKAAGPLAFTLRQQAALDLAAQTAKLPGELTLLREGRAQWQAALTGVGQGRPIFDFSLRPAQFRLDELAATARAFLPPGLSLGQTVLDLAGLDAQVLLPQTPEAKPQIQARLEGLGLEARDLVRTEAGGGLRIARALLRVDSAQASLPGAEGADPGNSGKMEALLSAGLEGLRLGGTNQGQAIAVQSAAVTRLAVQADGVAPDPAALFGVRMDARAELRAEARGIEASGKAQVPALTQGMQLRARLPGEKSLSAALESLNLDIPALRVLRPGKKAVEAPLRLTASAPDIRLAGLAGSAPLVPGVRGASLRLDMGGALACDARLNLAGPTGRDLDTDGSLRLDAGRLTALAAQLLPPHARASGGASLDWKLSATLPQPVPPAGKPGQPERKKLSETIRELAFVHQAEAVLQLSGLSLDWPLAPQPGQPGQALRLTGLATPKPLRVHAKNGAQEASLTGSLAFGPLAELPGAGRLPRPLRGLMTVNAQQQGARSVQFAEALHLDGLELDQNLSLNLDRLDLVLDRETDRIPAILELVDGQAAFRLALSLAGLPENAAGLSGKGRLEAGFDARLSGGRGLRVSARFLSPGLDLRLGDGTEIGGLASTLRLDKRYVLAQGLRCAPEAQEALLPLSEQVFDILPAPGASGGVSAFAQAAQHELQTGRGGVLSLGRVRLKSGPLPLDLRDISLALDAGGPVPALRSFRAGLLGGNLLGSARVRSTAAGYVLDADCAFAGIDANRLLPDKALKDIGAQAEAAGRVSLSVPLTPDPEVLLQRLNLRADITKVGPRTLERLLYALDPDEQNETIVQQRRLMALGFPRNLRLAVAYGNLSLSGAVEVKGFQLDLPQIDRLSVANLPVRKQLAKPLAAMPGLVKALDAVAAGGICRDPAAPPGGLKVANTIPQQGVLP